MRSAVRDGRASPIENLARNPRFRRAMNGSSVARRNLAIDPQGSRVGTGFGFNERWAGSGGSQTVGTVTGAADGPVAGVTRYARKTWTVVGQAQDISFAVCRGGRMLLTPGRTYTISLYWRSSWNTSIPSTFQNNMRVIQYDASTGSGALSPVTLQTAHLPAPAPGAWQRQSVTFTATAERPWIDAFHSLYSAVPSVGSTLDATALLVEERPGVLPFFDGATVADDGITYAWEGSAFASASQARALVAATRTNLFTNPRAVGSTNFAATPSQATISNDGAATRWTFETTGAIGINLTFPTASGSHRLLVRARANKSIVVSARVGGNEAQGYATLSTDWQWVDITAESAGTTFWGLVVRGTTHVPGDWIEIDRVLIAAGGDTGAWFDGAESPEPDLSPSWAGTANRTTSSLDGVRIQNAIAGNNARIVLGYLDGKPCMRGIPFGTNASTEGWAIVAGNPPTTSAGLGVTFLPGRTYTVMARSYIAGPQTNTWANARRIQALAGSTSGVWTTSMAVFSTQAPNVAGWSEHRLTFTVPADAAWAGVRLGIGAGGGTGDCWWADLAIVEGRYDGPYLDGDMPGCVWRGTPHDSPSVGYSLAA